MAILFRLAVRKTLKILLYSFPNGDGLQVQQWLGKERKNSTDFRYKKRQNQLSFAIWSTLSTWERKREETLVFLSQLEAVVVIIAYLAVLPARFSFIYNENKEKAENWEGKANKENMNSENIMIGTLLLQSFDVWQSICPASGISVLDWKVLWTAKSLWWMWDVSWGNWGIAIMLLSLWS